MSVDLQLDYVVYFSTDAIAFPPLGGPLSDRQGSAQPAAKAASVSPRAGDRRSGVSPSVALNERNSGLPPKKKSPSGVGKVDESKNAGARKF